jgi:hypothetical protein
MHQPVLTALLSARILKRSGHAPHQSYFLIGLTQQKAAAIAGDFAILFCEISGLILAGNRRPVYPRRASGKFEL